MSSGDISALSGDRGRVREMGSFKAGGLFVSVVCSMFVFDVCQEGELCNLPFPASKSSSSILSSPWMAVLIERLTPRECRDGLMGRAVSDDCLVGNTDDVSFAKFAGWSLAGCISSSSESSSYELWITCGFEGDEGGGDLSLIAGEQGKAACVGVGKALLLLLTAGVC